MEQPSRYEEEFQYDFYEVPLLLSVAFLAEGFERSIMPLCRLLRAPLRTAGWREIVRWYGTEVY